MDKPIKVKSITLYQPVTVGKRPETFITVAPNVGLNKKSFKNISMILHKDKVYLRDHKTDEVRIIFCTNIAELIPLKKDEFVPIWKDLDSKVENESEESGSENQESA